MYDTIMAELNVAVRPRSAGVHAAPIAPLYMGQEACPPRHRYGRLRDHYLVHYVASGTGTLYAGEAVHTLGPGQAFLLMPEQDHWYQADARDPWEYWWLGFEAPPVETLVRWVGASELSSVLLVRENERFRTAYLDLWTLLDVSNPRTPPAVLMQKTIAVLMTLISHDGRPAAGGGADAERTVETRWRRVRSFVEAHYCEPMTVDAICRATGTSRAELHRTFTLHADTSPMRYVTALRMQRAAQLLTDADRPIHRIAPLVGYREYQTFVREFGRRYGMSPRAFRHAHDRAQRPEHGGERTTV